MLSNSLSAGSMVGCLVLASAGAPAAERLERWPEIQRSDQVEVPSIVRGTVSASSGTAVRFAIVTLWTLRGAVVAETRTDPSGRFELKVRAPGRYEVSASAPGFLLTYWGENASNGVRRRLDVSSERRAHDVSLTLSRGGAISGRVVDEGGEPLEGIGVYALEAVFTAGVERVVPGAVPARLSDDQGRFRLYGLPRGNYYVVVSPGLFGTGVGAAPRTEGYAMTFAPGSTDVSGAWRLPVGAAQELETGDIILAKTRFLKLTGRVTDESGAPMPRQAVRLFPGRSGTVGLHAEATTAADGSFDINGLSPGTYTLQTGLTASTPARFGSRVLSLQDDSMALLEARPGLTVTGVFIAEQDGSIAYSPRDLDVTPVAVDFAESPVGGGGSGRVNADGTFQLVDLWGPQRVRIDRTPPGVGLKAVLVGGVDYTDRPIDFRKVSGEKLRIVLTTRVAAIEGVVRDRKGQVVADCDVLLFPPDRETWDLVSSRLRRAVTDATGRFSFDAVLPQAYRLVAVRGLPVTGWRQRDYLDTIIPESTTLIVDEGQRKRVELSLSDSR